MALNTTPTYIDAATFKAFTRVTAQKTMDDADINPQILHAELIIDSYIGYVNSYSEDQNLKFPENDDGNSVVPNDVQKACIEIVSQLILDGEPDDGSNDALKKEAWSSSGYSREYAQSNTKGNESISVGIPPIAKRLLRPWCIDVAPATY